MILRPGDGRENLFSSTYSQPPLLCSGTLFVVSGIPESLLRKKGNVQSHYAIPPPCRCAARTGRTAPPPRCDAKARMQSRLRPAGGFSLPCPGGRSMGTSGSLGTLRRPGVWYIACHEGMRTLLPGAAAGADGRGRGDGGPAYRNLASRQRSHYISGVADTMTGGAYSIAGRRGNRAGGRTHYGTGRCRAKS